MKKIYSLLLCSLVSIASFGQTSTVNIFASGATSSFTTGNATSSVRADGNIVVANSTPQRGYAVFNLSSIPVGSTITSATLGYTIASTPTGTGTPTATTYGFAGTLSTVTTASTLFSDMVAGTIISTAAYTNTSGAKTIALNAAGSVGFFTANEGSTVSVCWTISSSTRVITITGETGTAATTGTHCPFLTIVYTPPCSGTPASGNTVASSSSVCTGLTTNLSLQTATPGTGVSYQWSSAPDVSGSPGTYGAIGGAVSATYTPTITATTWYKCAVTCGGSTGTSNQIQITALAVPGVITAPASLCNFTSATLTDGTSGGTWSSGTTTIATINSSTGALTGLAPGNTTITYTGSDGCLAPTVVVTVNPAPNATSVTPASSYSVCLGSGAVPTAHAIGPVSTTIVSQNFNSGMTGAIGGTWTTANTGPASTSPYNWSIINPGTYYNMSYYFEDVIGDGTPFMAADPAEQYFSAFNTSFISPSFSTVGYTSVSIVFNQYLESFEDTKDEVDVSINGGTTWVKLHSYNDMTTSVSGSSSYSNITWTNTPLITLALPAAALGQASVMLRWLYVTPVYYGEYWAVDNIVISGSPSPLPSSDFTWAGTAGATGLSCSVCATPTITPTALGANVYSVTATFGSCSTSNTVTVNVFTPGPIGANTPLCTNSSPITLTNSVGSGTWSSSNSTIASIDPSAGTVTPLAVGFDTITYTIPLGCTKTAIVTVNALPNLSSLGISSISPPCPTYTSVVTVNSSSLGAGTYTVTYSLSGFTTATGNTSTLTMGSGGTGTFTTSPFAAAGSTTLTITAITNSNGCSNTPSGTVSFTFTVNPLPATITSSGTICQGSSVTLGETSGGGTWTTSNVAVAIIGSSTGTVLGTGSGVAAITYTLPTTCMMITSESVNPAPALNTVTGGGGFCPGASGVHIGLSGSVAGTSYQLIRGSTPVLTALPGTGSALDYGLITTTGTYFILATNTVTACSATMTGSATVSLSALPTAYNVTGTGPYCAGSGGTHIGLASSELGRTYQLILGGTTPVGSGVTGTGTALDLGVVTTPGTYTVIADSLTPCHGAMSGSVTVSILAAPVNTYTVALTGSGNFCAGSIGVPVTLSNSDFGINYQLNRNGSAVAGALVSGTGAGISFGLQATSGTYTVLGVNTSTGCTSTMTGSPVITVNPLPTAYAVTGGGGYCAGSNGVHVGLSNSTTGVKYQLKLGGATNIGSALPGTGSPLDFGLQTTTGVYTVVATDTTTANACQKNMTGSVTVTTNPLPTAYTVSVTNSGVYCIGGTGVTVNLGGSASGTDYQLYDGATLGTITPGTNSPISFGLQTAVGIDSVVATNLATGCKSTMANTITVTTNPLPVAYFVVGGGGYCVGGTGVDIRDSLSDVNVNYQLFNGTIPVGSFISGNGGVLDFGLQTIAGTYTIVGTSTTTGCSIAMKGAAVVNVNNPPHFFNVLGGGSYCAGGTGVPIYLSGSTNGIKYQLFNGATLDTTIIAVGSGIPISFGLDTTAGSYTILATNTVTGCSSTMTGSASVTVNALPVAYTVTGGGAYCIGGTGVHIGLSDSRIGDSYQLKLGATNVGASAAGVAGAIDYGLITAVGTYSVVATNTTTGCVNNMTGSVTVTTNPLPAVNSVTTNGVVGGSGAYCAGGTGVAVGLNGSVTTSKYQLYRNGTALGAPVTTSGGVFSFGSQTVAGLYTVVATDLVTGCTSNMTGSANITITPLPTVYTISGGGNLCLGGTTGAPMGLSGSTAGVIYNLKDGASIVATITSTGGVLSFGFPTTGGVYTVVATDPSTGCSANMLGTATINVNPVPLIDTVIGGGGYCAGSAGSPIGLNTSTTGVNYQLYNGSVIAAPLVLGTGSALNFGNFTATGTYTVTATIAATGCSSPMQHSAIVSINPLPGSFTTSGTGSYCVGGTGVPVMLSGSAANIKYRLSLAGSPFGGFAPGTGSSINFGPQTAPGIYTIVATDTLTGCSRTMPGSAIVSVNPLPNVYAVSGGGSYCPGGTGSDILLNGSDIGVNYQLNNGSPVGGTVAGTGVFIDFGLHTPVATYKVIATDAHTGCTSVMDDSAIVSLYTAPAVYTVSGGGGYCPGSAGAVISLSHSDGGISYQLHIGAASIGSPMTGIGDSLHFAPQTTTGTYTIVATDATTNCTSNMASGVTVSVNPLPTAFHVTGGGEFCPGGTGVHVGVSGSATGISYQLLNNGVAVAGSVLAGTGTAIDFGLQTATGSYTVVATNTTTNCVSNMAGSATVANYAAPAVYMVSGGGSYCIGGTGEAVSLAGSDIGASYQLYYDGIATGSPLAGTGDMIDFGLHTAAGTYSVIATNTTDLCKTNMADSAEINIHTPPAIFPVLGATTGYCAGGAGVDIYMGGTSTGVNYQLYNGTAAVGPTLAGTGDALDFGYQPVIGTYTVVATDAAAGCTSNMLGSVIVFINPLPADNTVIGGGSYCFGGAGVHVGLTGSTSAIHYQLFKNDTAVGGSVSGTGGALDFGLQTAVGAYTVVATNTVNACSANMSGSATIFTLPLPGTFPVTGGGSYCAGGTGVNIGLSGSELSTTYQLQNGSVHDGLPITGTTSALNFGLHTAAGIYNIIATNTATGCSVAMTGTAPVVINPLPVVYTIIGGGNYCPGGAGVHVGLSGSVTGVNYQLYLAGVPVAGMSLPGNGAVLDFGSQTATGSYTVMATDAVTSCVNNMAGAASVGLNTLPTVYHVTGGGNYCTGGTGVHVTLSGSDAGIHYELFNSSSVPGVIVTGTGSPLDFGLVTGADVYTAVATNTATGCTSNMAGSAAITISAPVTPSVTVSAGGGDTLCSGVAGTFTANPVNGGAAPAYQWTVNGIPVTATGNTFNYIASNGDNIGVVLTSNANCASPAVVSGSLTVAVLPSATPVVNVLATPGDVVCQGTAVTFTADPVYGGANPTYSWVVNGAYVGDSSNAYSYITNNGDVIFCVMVSDYMCRVATRVPSADVTMIVDPAIVPVVTITADPGTYVSQGQTVTLTASVANGGPSPAYQWFLNTDPIYGATSSSLTGSNYNNLDSVTCQVTSNGVCSGLVGFNTVSIHIGNVGVQQVSAAGGDMVLVPNPNNGTFTVKGSTGSAQDEEVSLEVTDMLGQVIYNNKVIAHNGMINERIQLSNTLANGMYMLNLRSASGNKVFHMVVEQ